MHLRHFNTYFFLALLLGVGVAVVFILQPFLTSIIMAAVLATLFRRPYGFFLRIFHGRVGWSAFATCILVFLVIITPLLIVLGVSFSEANATYHSIGEANGLRQIVERSVVSVRSIPHIGLVIDQQSLDTTRILAGIEQAGKNFFSFVEAAYQSVTSFVIWSFIMFFSLFYFLIDGKRVIAKIMALSPLRDEYDQLLVKKFVSMSRATIKGTLVLGVIQGMIVWFMFTVAGVPSPMIWGFVTVIFAIIPMVGSGMVWLPAGAIMLLLGNVWQGIFILGFGMIVITTVEHTLRPRLVGRDTEMHPLLIFFGTLGGLFVFGLAGFIIGPIVMSLFMALADIYAREFSGQLKRYNASEEE